MSEPKVSIPNVVWRSGRPRYAPSSAQRAMGYVGHDLKTPAGKWMTFEQASAWSETHTKEVARRRAAKAATGRMPPRPKARLVTVEAVLDAFFLQQRMTGKEHQDGKRRLKPLSPHTVAGYQQMRRVLEQEAPEICTSAVAAIDKPIMYGLYELVTEQRGVAVGAALMRFLSAAFSYGIKKGLCPFEVNPCFRLGIETPEPRLRVAEPDEIEHLMGAAHALGRPEISDAIALGVWTGQRQSDRLGLVDKGLANGRRLLRQHKTGKLVAVPQRAALEATLRRAEDRRKEKEIKSEFLIVDENRGQPFQGKHYAHLFQAIRIVATHGLFTHGASNARICPVTGAAARVVEKYLDDVRGLTEAEAKRWPALPRTGWIIEPMNSLDGFTDQDLRDTAVTWLARAGGTIPEICAITGHSLQSATRILEHYLVLHPELADSAVSKLELWIENEAGTRSTDSTHSTVERRLTFPARSQ